jgi:hypothetical protein
MGVMPGARRGYGTLAPTHHHPGQQQHVSNLGGHANGDLFKKPQSATPPWHFFYPPDFSTGNN